MFVPLEPPPNAMPYAEERRSIALMLRRSPGQVYRLCAIKNAQVARQHAYEIHAAKHTMHMFGPAGSFEATARTVFGHTYVYIRYVGDSEKGKV